MRPLAALTALSAWLERLPRFLRADIWNGQPIQDARIGTAGGAILAVVRWLLILWDSLAKDSLLLRASALTYATILSIVPFLAVAFAVLKGFDFQNTAFIRDLLLRVFAREQIVDSIIEYINQTNVKTLGMVGVALLFVTVIGLFSNVEATFNAIWGAQQERSFTRKIADYISVSCIFPVFMVMAASLNTTLQSTAIMQYLLQNEIMSLFYYNMLTLAPYVSVWLALSFLYIYLPNTHVRPTPACLGGLVAGAAWILAQWVYVKFQIGAANYNAIYGSFAQVPLFLVWLYVSWVIVLVGAEMSFTFQHYRTFVREARFKRVSHAERQAVALAALLELTRRQYDRSPPPSLDELSLLLRVPPTLLQGVLAVLCQANLVCRVNQDAEERVGCIKAPDTIRPAEVLALFDHQGEAGVLAELRLANPDLPRLLEAFQILREEGRANLPLALLARGGKTAAEDWPAPGDGSCTM